MTETKAEKITDWHYATNGTQTGPVSFDEIVNAIKSGVITLNTKVWNGEGEWKKAGKTMLAEYFTPTDSTIPPPLAGEDIDNKFMWLLVSVPIIGVIIDLIAGTTLMFPSIIANVALCMLDEKKLKSAGHETPVHWSVFIVPIYLWKRTKLLSHQKHYFSAWVAVFFISIVLSVAGEEAAIEEAACPIVSDIIKSQLSGVARCMNVIIDEEVTTGFYRATATLNNGNELYITIEEKSSGMIHVQIPDQ